MNKIQGRNILHYEKARIYLIETKPQVTKRDLFFKRSFDIIFSFLVIFCILSWLLPVLALFIRLNSRGPIFFIQKRTGRNGKTFNCIKLRTMVVNDEANVQQAQADDPRITSFGKFLRLTCLDELPQFFNVLIGEMSVVGPRPHMIKDCREFSKIIREYHLRDKVKPGITGMAQVKGYRGQTNDFYDVVHRYKWDMFYVRNLSLNLDLRIIRLTITGTFKAIFAKMLKQEQSILDNPVYSFEATEYLN
jgi:putative colanic acid biosynthesis UDP-glucose lipid carrier transferase